MAAGLAQRSAGMQAPQKLSCSGIRAPALRCHAQQADTRRLAGKSERSGARRWRQTQQPQQRPPTPIERPQERSEQTSPLPSLWLESLEDEEAEQDAMRAADAPGQAAPQPPRSTAGAAAPPAEPTVPPAESARSAAAAAREAELSGSFGAPPPEVALSGVDRQRWERFMQEANPYDFPVRTVRICNHNLAGQHTVFCWA